MPISRQTRKDLVDLILLEAIPWAGRLDDVAFLSRLFDLDALPSRDTRFKNARGDIWQHRVNNPDDWDEDWVFHDSRFNIAGGDDDTLLGFLCEMVHPIVRPNEEDRGQLASAFNDLLRPEGWELARGDRKIKGRPIYIARPVADDRRVLSEFAGDVAFVLDSDYVSSQIRRMETAIDSDVDLAIGTAKEFLETVAKSVLDEREVEHEDSASITQLVRLASETVRLVPEGIRAETKASTSIKALLGNLASVVQRIAEIRNAYGTGHGKRPRTTVLRPRHAQLAVGAAITVGTFLFQTHQERD